MTASIPSRSELYLRFSRRTLIFLLLVVLTLGLLGLAMTLRPDGLASQLLARNPWLIPISIIIGTVATQTSIRRHRFTPGSPEVKAVMNDELRRVSLDRARHVAFITVLAAQMPIALLFSQTSLGLGLGLGNDLSVFSAVTAMALSTITLGMTVFLVSFLIFDRE